jgi:hypothetical protein
MSWRVVDVAVLVAILLAGCTPTQQEPTASPVVSPGAGEPDDDRYRATVQQRDFQIAYRLEAQTVRSEAVPLPLPEGFVWAELPEPGSQVYDGDLVGTIELEREFHETLARSAETNRVDAARLDRLGSMSTEIVAPVSGPLIVTGDQVAIGVSGIDLVVPLTGIQVLRLRSTEPLGQASVETVAGQRTVGCRHLWVEDARGDSGSEGESPAHLRCRLGPTVETAAGLRAGLQVTSPTVEDALVVPNAMLGLADDGYVVWVREDDRVREVPVDVGVSDGVVRVVTGDLGVGMDLVDPSEAG